MISIKKGPLKDPKWKALVRDAIKNEKVLSDNFDNGGKISFDDKLYKRYMPFLLDLFNGKCAYCESKMAVDQGGDVEHFRPKGRVVGDDFKAVRVNHPRKGEINHPGYYWLAYRWRNLFPACNDCNRYRNHRTGEGFGAGKADRFPVDGFRACCPGQERMEVALLVNPGDDIEKHLEFLGDGTIRAKSKAGEETLKILGLNRREALVEARRMAYDYAALNLNKYLQSVSDDDLSTVKVRARLINEIWLGQKKGRAALKGGATDLSSILSIAEPEEPKARRYVVNDATYEALGVILADNPNGTLAFRDAIGLPGYF
jgi:hypothetical protein